VGGSVAKWLACWTQSLSGNSLRQTAHSHWCLCSPSSKIGSSPLKGCGGNCGPVCVFVDMRARRWFCGLTSLSAHLGRVTFECSVRRRGHCWPRSLRMPDGSMLLTLPQPPEWSVYFFYRLLISVCNIHTHTYIHLTALSPGLPG